jgi:tRNA threonylcarbamoyladenosine modification (KEOPS) complex  Pcc1 subunit
MTGDRGVWTATVALRPTEPGLVDVLERALRPESAREVPRARATLTRDGEASLVLTVEARDPGAMRAALNTYLGWVHLVASTVRASAAAPREPDRADRSGAR